MAKITLKGLDEFVGKLDSYSKKATEAATAAVYDGAAIVADEIRKSIEDLPVQGGFVPPGTKRTGLQPEAKQGLLDSLGISPMQKKGGAVDVRVGFDGYNKIKTKQFPKGLPNQMIAREAESGNSFTPAFHFVRKAINRSRKKAVAAMQEAFTKKIEE